MELCDCGKTARASCDCGDKIQTPIPGLFLAMATIPMQPWETMYEPDKALKQGTIFPGLDKPFYLTGGGGNV